MPVFIFHYYNVEFGEFIRMVILGTCIAFVLLWGHITGLIVSSIDNQWRFWILKNTDYLQDFVFIRRFAEKVGYIDLLENWLNEKYIKKKSKGKERMTLLEKLEIYEFAFQKNNQSTLPKVIQYKVSPKKVRFAIIIVSFCGLLYTSYLVLCWMKVLNLNMFVVLIIPMLVSFFLPWKAFLKAKYFFLNTIMIKVNENGIKAKKHKNYKMIPWTCIQKLKYTEDYNTGVRGETAVPYLNIYLKSTKKNKRRADIKINIDKLNIESRLLFRQVDMMYKQYLDKQK